MRATTKKNGLTVRAVSGTHVVFLAFDLSEIKRVGCLGFAIRRRDKTEGEDYWLDAMKTFRETNPEPGPGIKVSTRDHPIQGFQWADYSAKPSHKYSYHILPLYGSPSALISGTETSVDIETEAVAGSNHQVHFNRGAVASQEYARRFQNKKPSEVQGNAAYNWLSRGLEEGLAEFIKQAKGPNYSLRAAVYEIQWPKVLAAFKAAADSGAEVKIIYDAIPKDKGPKRKNYGALKSAGLLKTSVPRTVGSIMHNKFVVLLKKGKPISVWTGSTNITENGIFGHLNVGHSVIDADVSRQYLNYWNELSKNPKPARMREWTEENNELLPLNAEPRKGVSVVFSPRRGLNALQWIANLGSSRSVPIFITLAFGMHKFIQKVYKEPDNVLRVALLEKPGNGAGLAQGRIDINAIRKLPNVLVAIGHHVMANRFDRWLKEIDRVHPNVNVRWVHTKFLLIDPLGPDPIVISGSANFSKASIDTNDENILIIRGNTRVADIYFTEYLRIYTHHAFRESLTFNERWSPKHLETNWRIWQKPYFTKGNEHYLRRLYYAGS